MYAKIEGSGCCERKGLVQIRLCFYLDKDDYGYEKHHIQVPDFTDAKYDGKVDELGNPVDMVDYQKWVDSLPKAWQNNPFHNHFIYIEPDTSEKEIMALTEAYLHEAGVKWSCDEKIDCKNYGVDFPLSNNCELILKAIPEDTKDEEVIMYRDAIIGRLEECETKLAVVKAITTEVKA